MHSFRYESIDSKSDYVLQLCTYILSYSVYVMLATGFIQVKLHQSSTIHVSNPQLLPHPHPITVQVASPSIIHSSCGILYVSFQSSVPSSSAHSADISMLVKNRKEVRGEG